MEKRKNLGIWMDHSNAHLIDIDAEKNNCSLTSDFTTEAKEEALSRSENVMHNKEQQMHEAFYKEIANEILKYDKVLLFGPTRAKDELHNFLNEDLHFKEVSIEIESADNMESNQRLAFVKNHFENK